MQQKTPNLQIFRDENGYSGPGRSGSVRDANAPALRIYNPEQDDSAKLPHIDAVFENKISLAFDKEAVGIKELLRLELELYNRVTVLLGPLADSNKSFTVARTSKGDYLLEAPAGLVGNAQAVVAEIGSDGVVQGGSIGGKAQSNLNEIRRVVNEAITLREIDYIDSLIDHSEPRIKDAVKRA